MNDLSHLFTGDPNCAEYAKKYTSYLLDILKDVDCGEIEKAVELLEKARAGDNTVFLIGNGGSAATCSHFCEDLAYGMVASGKKPVRALSLTDNTPYITALGNDEGYENAFVGQLRSLYKPGDVLFAVSGSGNSLNLIKAVEYANKAKVTTVGLLGFDGGKMKDLCQHCILVKSAKGAYAPVEDIHLIITHIIATYFMFGPDGRV